MPSQHGLYTGRVNSCIELAEVFSWAISKSQVREITKSDYHVTWYISQFLSYKDQSPIAILRAPVE